MVKKIIFKSVALNSRTESINGQINFKFLTFTRPLAIPSNVSAALLKNSFAFVSHFIAEEGYSIFTGTFSQKVFSQWQQNILILIIIMPEYSTFIQLDHFRQNSRDILIMVMSLKYNSDSVL